MAAATINVPPGFVLDQQPQSGLPDGFVLDSAPPGGDEPRNLRELITHAPTYYREAAQGGLNTMSGGYNEAKSALLDEPHSGEGAVKFAKGVGKTALGAVEYAASPVTAALRTVVGRPVEAVTGIPKETTELAASLVLPIPKRIPIPAGKTQAAVPTAKELVAKGAEGYRTAEASGASFAPEAVGKLSEDIAQALKAQNSRDYLAPQTFRAIEELRTEGPASIADLRGVRELLGRIREDGSKFERRAAGKAIDEIDGFIAAGAPAEGATLQAANRNYAAGKRAEKLDVAQDVAGLRTGRAGYGGNAVNAMRQVLSPIVERAMKGKASGFSRDEIAAVREIVEGNATTNTLRGIGQLSPSKGAISTAMSAGSLGATAVVGGAAHKLAAALTRKQVERLNELVRKRSPVYEEAVSRAADKYASAAEEMMSSPSPQSFARLVVSTRSLAAGLNRDGINVSSGDLLRQLTGSMPSSAEDEQQ